MFVLTGSTAAQRAALERDGVSDVDPSGFLHFVAPSILVHLENHHRTRTKAGADAPPWLGPAAARVAITLLLERAGFVRKAGRGPQTKRTLTNASGVAELLRQTVLRQRRPPSTPVYVYAPRLEALWTKITDALGENAVISGAALPRS